MISNREQTMAASLVILSDENISDDFDNSDHARHLRLARQMLEKATDEWWHEHEGQNFGGQLSAAMTATWSLAKCDDACGASPRNQIR